MDKPAITGTELANAWAIELPKHISSSDHAKVWPDESDDQALRVHMVNSGRSSYTFDFKCTYVDSREVKVDLVDVERDQEHIDEHSPIVQEMISSDVRHIHECAQALRDLTHGG